MKQLETDVAIIGGGTAGLAAAVAAAERGTRVTVFEKASTTGGTGNMATGPFAVESRLQQERRIALTREEAFKIHMDFTHWRVDARLVKTFIDKSASTIDWLEQMGIEFSGVMPYFTGASATWHVIKTSTSGNHAEHGAASLIMKAMTDKAVGLGVKILLQTPAKKILKENGRISGVVAEDNSGEEIRAKAKAVIISTGGFGDNPEWIKKYTGYEWGRDLFSMRVPGLVGDGLRMAWEVGAMETEMHMQASHGLPDPFHGPGGTSPGLAPFRQPNLMVNLPGERFMNEETMSNYGFTANAIHRQKNGCAFIIFDEDTKKYYEENIVHFVDFMRVDNLDANISKAQEQGYKHVFVADSLEKLCAETEINIDGLRKTLDVYNKACATGRDELFHKNPTYLRPVKQPKFYAGRFYLSAHGSLGGIRINYKTQVLARDLEVIPGLYGAGTDANTIYGDTYPFTLSGNTFGFALNSGLMAGENASEYVKSV